MRFEIYENLLSILFIHFLHSACLLTAGLGDSLAYNDVAITVFTARHRFHVPLAARF